MQTSRYGRLLCPRDANACQQHAEHEQPGDPFDNLQAWARTRERRYAWTRRMLVAQAATRDSMLTPPE